MKDKTVTLIARVLLVVTLGVGFTALAQHNISQNVKAETVAETYDIPVNLINKRCDDGMSIKEIEKDLASGDLIYYEGQLVNADYIDW